MPAKSSGTFASSNKLLQKKWEDRQYKAHKQKMDAMRNKGSIDTRPPKQYPHLVLRLKQVQKEEERQATIDHSNQLLLHKMTDIMRKKGRVDNWNDYESKSLNHGLRERQQEKISMENYGIATRLEGIRPVYDTDSWEHQFQDKHEYFLDNWSKDTKEFSTSPRGPGKRGQSWEYEDDFENDEEMGSRRFPEIPSRGSSHQNLSTKGSAVRLPKIKTGKDAIIEQDCKLLFKATKLLVNPHEALNRALIRKTHAHRMANKEKFTDMYDLELEKELKEICSREHDTLIECLLTEREAVDAETINQAIYDNNMEELVIMLCSRNTAALTSINRKYQQLFDAKIEEDINDKVVDDACQAFLRILIKPRRMGGDVDPSLADQDALDLFEAPIGRFTEEEGEFLKIMVLRSLPQIKAAFSTYRMVSGGESIMESMEKDGCSKDYISCVQTLCNCMFGSGRYYAMQIHDTMNPKNKDFVNLLLARSEIDMGLIRRAYKREYGLELADDLLQRCGETGALLAQIAAKGAAAPTAQSRGHGGAKADQGRRLNGMYIQGPNKRHPLRRPAHLDKDMDTRHNPLAHKGMPGKGKPAAPAQRGGGGGGGGGAAAPSRTLGGTVFPSRSFNVDSDVEAVHEAMRGWGTDEAPLIDVLAYRSNAQRQQVRAKYPDKHKKDLIEALKSELTGDFEELIVALIMTPAEYDAYCLHDAMAGLGTREATLIGILCSRTNRELQAVQREYADMYGGELREAVIGDTSGDFKDLLKQLLKCERSEGNVVDRKLAEADAKELYKEGKFLLDVNDKVFREVMCRRHRAQVRATFDLYKKLAGQSVESGLREAMLGDEEDGYVALAQAISDPVDFYARQLEQAMKGAGTNDATLIRVIVSRSEIDLADVKVRYRERTRRTLEDSIRKECGGSYKHLLLAIVKDKPVIATKLRFGDASVARDGATHGHTCAVPNLQLSPILKRSAPHLARGRSSHKSQRLRGSQPPVSQQGSKSAGAALRLAPVKRPHAWSNLPPPVRPVLGRGPSTLHSARSSIHEHINFSRKLAKCEGTIKQKMEVDAISDARNIHEAIQKWHEEQSELIGLLVTRTNEQRQSIRNSYNELYNKTAPQCERMLQPLLEALTEALRGAELGEVVRALVLSVEEYDAHCVRDALTRLTTDHVMLHSVLAARSPQQLDRLCSTYRATYGEKLSSTLRGAVTGEYGELLVQLLKGERDVTREVEPYLALQDAYKLDRMLKQGDCSLAGVFSDVLTLRNIPQLQEIFAKFNEMSEKPLDNAVKGSMCGDFEHESALISLIKYLRSPFNFYADRLRSALSSLGIDYKLLISFIVSRSEIDLVQIKEVYVNTYDRSLLQDIETKCEGEFSDLLCAIVKGSPP